MARLSRIVIVNIPDHAHIYSGGTLIAKIESGATQYYHEDHLSVRLMTDASGNVLGQQGHYPHGQSWYAQNTTTKWTFTSYERDAESGNDYAMARYDVNRLGRFASLDPFVGDTGNPQSLNRYSYVANDPVNSADPTGMLLMKTPGGVGGGGGCDPEFFDCGASEGSPNFPGDVGGGFCDASNACFSAPSIGGSSASAGVSTTDAGGTDAGGTDYINRDFISNDPGPNPPSEPSLWVEDASGYPVSGSASIGEALLYTVYDQSGQPLAGVDWFVSEQITATELAPNGGLINNPNVTTGSTFLNGAGQFTDLIYASNTRPFSVALAQTITLTNVSTFQQYDATIGYFIQATGPNQGVILGSNSNGVPFH